MKARRLKQLSLFALSFAAGLGVTSLEASETVISCKKTGSFGLHHQCQEVKVLKNLKSRVRLYKEVDRQVATVKREKLYRLSPLGSATPLQKDQRVMVRSNYFIPSSSEKFSTICRLQSHRGNNVNVQCGKTKPVAVPQKFVFLPEPHQNPVPQHEKNILSNSTQKSNQKF